MTTLILKKTMAGTEYSISFEASKVTEQIDKPSGVWNDYVSPPDWETVPAKRNNMDSKSITNMFNVAGRISASSLTVGSTQQTGITCNAPYVRDVLRAFMYMGGTSTLHYGIPADIVGLNSSTVNFAVSTNPGNYYSTTGVEIQITKLSIDEGPKGGDSGSQTIPDLYQGTWNANTNEPQITSIPDTEATEGYFWRVSAPGTTSLGGITPWAKGDIALKKETGWEKVSSMDNPAVMQVPSSYAVQMAMVIVSEISDN